MTLFKGPLKMAVWSKLLPLILWIHTAENAYFDFQGKMVCGRLYFPANIGLKFLLKNVSFNNSNRGILILKRAFSK